ncbi:MAG: hypothetical protein KatS3mg105_0579 [Gemmatales bacterium]|nr:MAG: hypothetical protein KatS3mg105_0579 [Gemmatales bacterium]
MNHETPHRDLIVLTADKNAQFAIRGIMSRHKSLGIRNNITTDFHVHSNRDPGVLRDAHHFLRSFCHSHQHALVVFDREGCGRKDGREDLEGEVEANLSQSGWDDRARVIVIDPELEVWVWSDSPHVSKELGWKDCEPDLRTWLTENGFFQEGASKPERPKEAVEAVLRQVRVPRSSAIYESLAKKVGFSRCQDQAFEKLKNVLQEWFAET